MNNQSPLSSAKAIDMSGQDKTYSRKFPWVSHVFSLTLKFFFSKSKILVLILPAGSCGSFDNS